MLLRRVTVIARARSGAAGLSAVPRQFRIVSRPLSGAGARLLVIAFPLLVRSIRLSFEAIDGGWRTPPPARANRCKRSHGRASLWPCHRRMVLLLRQGAGAFGAPSLRLQSRRDSDAPPRSTPTPVPGGDPPPTPGGRRHRQFAAGVVHPNGSPARRQGYHELACRGRRENGCEFARREIETAGQSTARSAHPAPARPRHQHVAGWSPRIAAASRSTTPCGRFLRDEKVPAHRRGIGTGSRMPAIPPPFGGEQSRHGRRMSASLKPRTSNAHRDMRASGPLGPRRPALRCERHRATVRRALLLRPRL